MYVYFLFFRFGLLKGLRNNDIPVATNIGNMRILASKYQLPLKEIGSLG